MHKAWLWVGALVVGCGSGASPGAPEATETTSEALQQCETNSVEGVDVYDGTGTIDWNAVKGAGVDFAMIKATQGTYDTQTNFATNWSGSKAAGLYRSAYHFFDPTQDGVAQAKYYLSVVGALGPDDLPPMLDIECPDGDPNCMYTGGSGQAAASDIQTRMWDWIHTVEQATGKKPIIYTFGSYFSSNGIDATGLGAYPLFIADIVSGNCFAVPSPWSSAVMWQYSWTGTVAGISGQVDRDKFIGTLADLQGLAQGGNGTLPFVNGNDTMSAVNWPSDGHVELFLTTTKATAQHVYTNGLTDTWTQVYDYEGAATCGIASAMWPTSSWGPYAELYDPSPGGDTQHLSFGQGGWTPFADFGGAGLTHLSAVVAQDGHVEVYGLAPDGSIQANAWDLTKGAWGGWQSLGGNLATGAAPIVWNDGRIELFATDAQGAAWHDSTSGGKWAGWQSLGGQLASRPVPVRWPDGHVEIYARDAAGHTVSSVFHQAWAPFSTIESTTTLEGSISAVLDPAGVGAAQGAELFARTADGHVAHMQWTGTGWSGWTPLGSQLAASDPLGWIRADGKGEVFAVDPAGNVVKSYRDGSGTWSAWAAIATGIDACASTTAIGADGGSGPVGDDGGNGSAGGDGGAWDGANGSAASSSGCGCRVAQGGEGGEGGQGAWQGLLPALLLGAVAARRKRRRSRKDAETRA